MSKTKTKSTRYKPHLNARADTAVQPTPTKNKYFAWMFQPSTGHMTPRHVGGY